MTEIIENNLDEYNEKSHKRLLEGIGRINKLQHIKKPTRNESAIKTSEFNLVKSKHEDTSIKPTEISLNGLINVLRKTSNHVKIGKQLQKLPKTRKTLKKNLEKSVASKIDREIGYENVKKKLSKWDAIVAKNRNSDQLIFPVLNEEVDIISKHNKNPLNHRIKSDLMKTLEELTPRAASKIPETDENQSKNFPLTLEELTFKRKEMARLRVKESYKHDKSRRMNKIKSKKYHKLLKREKIRSQIKEFEKLQLTDPEAALKKLDLIERTRIEERANLRHKNTGTWAKNLQIRARYDKDVRKELAQQLAIGRELSEKQQIAESSEDEEEIDLKQQEPTDPNNPWISSIGKENEVQVFVNSYRKYWTERNENEKRTKEFLKEVTPEIIEEDENENLNNKSILSRSGVWDVEDLVDDEKPETLSKSDESSSEEEVIRTIPNNKTIDQIFSITPKQQEENVIKNLKNLRQKFDKNSKKKTKKSKRSSLADLEFPLKMNRPILDVELDEVATEKIVSQPTYNSEIASLMAIAQSNERQQPNIQIDPNSFISMKPNSIKVGMNMNEIMELENDAIDDDLEENEHKLTLLEAFEEDDIVADFEKEKDDERKKNEVEDIDNNLPGWGSWAGCGITTKPSVKRPNKRFIVKMPKIPRRDDKKDNVIINENVNDKIRNHLVSQLPFPFTSVDDYESSISAPIGNTFVPETAHKLLTRPPIQTKLGAIINPMDENYLVKKKSDKNIRLSKTDERIKKLETKVLI